jgi:hypothetical protein
VRVVLHRSERSGSLGFIPFVSAFGPCNAPRVVPAWPTIAKGLDVSLPNVRREVGRPAVWRAFRWLLCFVSGARPRLGRSCCR